MTNDQARDILLLYRPGSADGEEPDVAEALEQAKHDPELATWFRQHCAFQEAVATGFDRIPIPEGLREQILSERKAHLTLGLHKKVAVLALALVVLVLLAGIAHFYSTPTEDKGFANYRSRMAGKVLREYPAMDLVTNDLTEIRNYLASHQGQENYALPPQLAQATGTGCAIFPWHGKRVSMICMNSGKNGAPMTPDLFLFIVERSAVQNPPPDQSLEKANLNGLATASWSSGDKVYLLAASGEGASVLRNL